MNEPKHSIVRRSAGFLLSYALPWRSISRSAGSVKDSLGRIGDAARGAADSMRADHERFQAAKQVQLTPEQQRMTPAELFQDSYNRFGWNEEDLKWNAMQFRRAKWACMSVACLAFGSGLFMMWTSTHPILAFFLGPTLLIASLVIAARGSIEAWKQAQIDLRSVADFKWFMSRNDLWKRLVV